MEKSGWKNVQVTLCLYTHFTNASLLRNTGRTHLLERCLVHSRDSIGIWLVDDRVFSSSYPGCWHCSLPERKKSGISIDIHIYIYTYIDIHLLVNKFYIYIYVYIYIFFSFPPWTKTLFWQGSNATPQFRLIKVKKLLFGPVVLENHPLLLEEKKGKKQPLITSY